jgi:hypothetical protein
MALRRLVYAMHVCERQSSTGHANGPSVQLCAAAPGHAATPERCAETARDGATAALRRAGQAAKAPGPRPRVRDHPQLPPRDTEHRNALVWQPGLKVDQNNSSCGAMACWALGPFGHGRRNPASIAAWSHEGVVKLTRPPVQLLPRVAYSRHDHTTKHQSV